MKRRGNIRTVVVGDVHGELAGLREVLRRAGLMDQEDRWSGGNAVLVQTGDMIDRGRYSKACTDLLRRLQAEAKASGGTVVRLCGNHELMVLQGDFWFVDQSGDDIRDIEAFRHSLEVDVAARTLLAAWSDGIRLFTHAGLRSDIRDRILEDIGENLRLTGSGLVKLADHVNRVFRQAAAGGDMVSHPIFQVSFARGGNASTGGIFWADWSEFEQSLGTYSVPQVLGHTPSRDGRFLHSRSCRLIDVDGGMSAHYGGNRTFLEIAGKEVVQHRKDREGWMRHSVDQ